MSEQKFRVESDLLGELQVPADAYYGVQTQRALNNYQISNTRMCDYPEYVIAIAYVKMAAAAANAELGVLDKDIAEAICAACREIVAGKFRDQFPVDMMQGGAGTSVNMNANEVIANRALELMGHKKGEYQYCSPNDHVNCAQSTNDAYPTAFRYTFVRMNKKLVSRLGALIAAFRAKGVEFQDYIKMGRTQLQDAVPMTAGQEFNAFATNLEEEIANLERNAVLLREIIAQYLARSRRMNVSPDQIVIGSGSEYLYNLIVQILGRERTFALEDPSYEKIRLVYEASGVHCEMLPMDREGVRLSALRRSEASVLHVTPFNSYPSGITATASRRAGYIKWAASKDRYIIEDDFDSEFSMSTKAENTLFSLEPQQSVIYMNTFTRTISPAVRVGYMVLPAGQSAAMKEKISIYSCTVPVFTQHLLAELIRSGDFERHINRVRRRRRQAAES